MLLQDIRFALRSFSKARGFTAVAVVTLALGMGANTAIFSIVDAVLLRPLPFRDPARLVRVTGEFSKQGIDDVGMSVAELFDFRDRAGVFEDIAGIFAINANLTGTEEPERVEAQLVSANYFTLLGAKAQLGRVFDQTDYQPGNAEVVVLSDSLWKRRFGADRGVIGRKIRFDQDLFEVVGVLPPSFHHPGPGIQTEPELWSPSGYVATPFPARPNYGGKFLGGAFARLKRGVSLATAQARLDMLGATIRNEHPRDFPDAQGWHPRVIPLQHDFVGRVQPLLMVLLCAVGAVLLIACANVANLMLARASARSREFAIRGALGATRARLVRQLLTESLVLAGAGGLLGILAARYLLTALTLLVPAGLPRATEIAIDSRVLAFTAALSLLTGVLFGVWPALNASPSQAYDTLKDSTRSVTAGLRRTRVRGALVIAEFALALVLLVTAALLVRSFISLYRVDTGFSADHVLTSKLWMPQPNDPTTGPYFKPEARKAFYRNALDGMLAVPGVEAAGWVSDLPLTGSRGRATFLIEGQPPETALLNSMEPMLATDGYFDALRIGLVSGRLFTTHDDETTPPVMVVNETFARKYFPNQDPIGKRIRTGGPGSTAPWATIIGVVHDTRTVSLDVVPKPQAFRSVWQISSQSMALVVRTAGDPKAFVIPIRQAVRTADAELPLYALRPMTSVTAASIEERRFSMTVLGGFATLAMLLSSIGIYGVLAYLVEQRTSEIGVRMALGADHGDILRLVLRQGLVLAAIGILVGLGGAVFAARAISTMLFGVSPFDPVTFAGIAVALTGVATLACYIPARHATHVDPLTALRQE